MGSKGKNQSVLNFSTVTLIFSTYSDSETENRSRQRSPTSGSPLRGNWRDNLQFWSLAVLLSLVGSRVSSLIVLEFSLRAVSAWVSAGLVGSSFGAAP